MSSCSRTHHCNRLSSIRSSHSFSVFGRIIARSLPIARQATTVKLTISRSTAFRVHCHLSKRHACEPRLRRPRSLALWLLDLRRSRRSCVSKHHSHVCMCGNELRGAPRNKEESLMLVRNPHQSQSTTDISTGRFMKASH